MVVDGLVDDLARDHDADVAVFDLAGVDELGAGVDGQLPVLDVEGAIDLLLGTIQLEKDDRRMIFVHSFHL